VAWRGGATCGNPQARSRFLLRRCGGEVRPGSAGFLLAAALTLCGEPKQLVALAREARAMPRRMHARSLLTAFMPFRVLGGRSALPGR
jgi:hypothetical protein